MKSLMKNILMTAGVLILMVACSQEPAEIHYGSDECAYCRMMISDAQFASQMVSETGKTIKFDAIECMAAYTKENRSEFEGPKLWVSDFNNPGNWIEVGNGAIVQSEVINSPMGASLLAFDSEESAKEHIQQYPGKIIEWETLVD